MTETSPVPAASRLLREVLGLAQLLAGVWMLDAALTVDFVPVSGHAITAGLGTLSIMTAFALAEGTRS